MSEQSALVPKPGIMDIALYISGEAKIAGHGHVLKLSANENPYGCSPAARAAFQAAAGGLNRYPATDHAPLRGAIGQVHGLDPDRIICGVGSDEVLQFAMLAFVGVGDEAIITRHGFSMYPILARAVGAVPVIVEERDRHVDVDAILAAVTDRTRVVFVTNPGNPTGTMLDPAEIERLVAALPPHVLLIHDGAYIEFAGCDDPGIALADAYPNVLATRTFSKIYGLGGLRIGWGYAQRSLIEVLARIRQPFNLSNAQMDTAQAAILDRDFTTFCRDENARLRDFLRQSLVQMGIGCDESHANFVLARFASPEQARGCDAVLRAAGILVRRVDGYHLPDCLRITVGTEDDCRRLIDVISGFMAHERGAE
ncbi:MAG: histidinol-phosphate transaminase [Paracoccus sp. (in: a-proteobacteria)]|uniref:histidinol-phosphate transaminase n=1 Tax=Paracoccus sp. TaxID=267 RepID=UPI0026E08EA6|nr:histidinol-phosphate transaminase [Paracoccus sp. (in: a-proteobacteria)]MDO5631536.1 histidinol-phosphate transaminase [Paracoccus sp. (in: a-proteobacteria)]